ncbi:MAG TPA: GAF domain-containing sensor histidine kinase, partial [Gaiellaceae bacterium]|nr:GAF domain-containing sensor histidine kinase [Gaiellaceae bacterium]
VGFPPNHPPMASFLGVPIVLRSVAWGNLYLTEKRTGDFTQEDEDLIGLLASQAAVAIENARLYESATRWSRQLESLTEVGNALALEIELEPLLDLIAERLRELLNARDVFIVLPRRETLMVVAGSGDAARALVGDELPERSKTWRILERRRGERVDSLLDDPEVDQEFARRLGARTGLFVPLVVRDRTIGAVVAHDKVGDDARFSDIDLRLAETFASRAAVAVDMSERVGRDALRRVVEAQELERRRLARELHDETGQALTSVLLGLRSLEDARTEGEMREAAANVRELVIGTLHDVRRLAVELRPKALDDFGLVPALERLTTTFAEKTGLSVELQTTFGEQRLPAEVETALYRIVQESLTNVVKHARASRVSVSLALKDDGVTAVVEDDGVGFLPRDDSGGVGLLGIRERVGLLGGRVEIESRPDAGTSVVVEVPVH